ncbi:hypothetical protein [Noviherbaspirillum pedocola]|uniref:Uncharacterized protein n=1 Tax=Noviherbaspirillum pedocola TaxID=2801341 RepID=A0A934W731_9BURK|nr:hypothetical protein [Noviherbaspirillum pedocola]MBK4735880.1 hypothetical protein [Noviherbaspirillum pedocola]
MEISFAFTVIVMGIGYGCGWQQGPLLAYTTLLNAEFELGLTGTAF